LRCRRLGRDPLAVEAEDQEVEQKSTPGNRRVPRFLLSLKSSREFLQNSVTEPTVGT
jgi:hypothetical protein